MKWTIDRRALIVQEVCEHIAGGGTVLDICPQTRDPERDYPTIGTFLGWMTVGEPWADEFRDAYNKARQLRLDGDEERMRAAANDSRDDLVFDPVTNTWRPNRDLIERVRLRISTMQWILQRRRPAEWGDKIDVTSGGGPVAAVALPGVVPLGSPLDAPDSQQKEAGRKPAKQKPAQSKTTRKKATRRKAK